MQTELWTLHYALGKLIDIIWKAGGYRFWQRRTTEESSSFVYTYHCSQDSSNEAKLLGKGGVTSGGSKEIDSLVLSVAF